MSSPLRVLVYGGSGALGAHCVSHFKSAGHWVCSVDLKSNDEADSNVIVTPSDTLVSQEQSVVTEASKVLSEGQLDAIFCVAGGWAGGNASNKDFVKNCELVLKQSVWTSVIAASFAAKFLKSNGLLTLTGAQPALGPTPGMMGYGLAKAGVHQLVRSLGSGDSNGLPEGVTVAAILPVTLDTPMNRKWMADGDTTTWTPLSFVAGLFEKWLHEAPTSGSLFTLVTKDNDTQVTSVSD